MTRHLREAGYCESARHDDGSCDYALTLNGMICENFRTFHPRFAITIGHVVLKPKQRSANRAAT